MKIILLTSTSLKSQIVYTYLKGKYDVSGVVVDNSNKILKIRRRRIKRRIKKMGVFTVCQQFLFCQMVIPLLIRIGQRRVNEIIGDHKIENPLNHDDMIEVENINDEETLDYLKQKKPDLVIVKGTSILSSRTLAQIGCPIINFHIGITPRYRGLHGGYWALYKKDKKNFGSTIHFVDKGIDTGDVIVQKRIGVMKADNFYTYQILQTKECLDCFDYAIEKIAKGFTKIEAKSQNRKNEVSRFYSHPTLLQYLYGRLFLGVK
jgi:folate-dependent phosphoribosylglycinamide formyltransferase PurN|tara:strand:+ start:1010 stop:1795 length:786 start_codon:yes stop_codon:yes gene_type:complete